MMRRWLLVTVITASAALVSGVVIFGQKRTHRIEGQVLDSQNQPIGNVLVRAYRKDGLEKVGESRTKEDGRYFVEFYSDSPISFVQYEATNWIPATVNQISGARDHLINKVLYKEGSRLSWIAGNEALASFETVYWHYQLTGGKAYPAGVESRYRALLKGLIVPEELQPRVKEIWSRYEKLK